MQRSRFNLGVALKVRPVLVATDDAHLMNVVAMLKHPTDALMAKVMEMQIRNGVCFASVEKVFGDELGVNWKYTALDPRLIYKDFK